MDVIGIIIAATIIIMDAITIHAKKKKEGVIVKAIVMAVTMPLAVGGMKTTASRHFILL
ncbi:hypothetical protein [Lacrimispora sp. JR3]|uniref:hypothetical protein n=1 Tax=Lacrimispora sinapis TaxID=3111456 RepID=UPI0037499049